MKTHWNGLAFAGLMMVPGWGLAAVAPSGGGTAGNPYQISQLDLPIIEHGKLEIVVGEALKTINVTRAHMEEDAGKSVHDAVQGYTGIDLNRAGTPLLEVVSEPEMRNAQEAVAYAKAMHDLVTLLEICDGNMA